MSRSCLYCKSSMPDSMNKQAKYCCKLCRHMAGYYKGRETPGPIDPRKCKWCEAEFTPKKQRTSIYCGDRCRMSATNNKHDNSTGDDRNHVISSRQERRNREVVCEERNEWSLEKCRKHYGLDHREPAKPVAKSLAECEVMKGQLNGTR